MGVKCLLTFYLMQHQVFRIEWAVATRPVVGRHDALMFTCLALFCDLSRHSCSFQRTSEKRDDG